MKQKEGIINTIAITNIVCATDLVIKEELQSVSAERQKESETLQESITSLHTGNLYWINLDSIFREEQSLILLYKLQQ